MALTLLTVSVRGAEAVSRPVEENVRAAGEKVKVAGGRLMVRLPLTGIKP